MATSLQIIDSTVNRKEELTNGEVSACLCVKVQVERMNSFLPSFLPEEESDGAGNSGKKAFITH